jgi:protoheme IX farnesyltransferase
MLPVVAGARATRIQILFYTVPMGLSAVAPWALGLTGAIYGLTAAVFSLVFLALSIRVMLNKATEPAGMAPEKKLFAFSILYLFALFGALVVDKLLIA